MQKKHIITTMMILITALMLTTITTAQNGAVIRFSVSNYDPMPIQPGQFVDVWINVQNIGNKDARDITIEFLDSPYFTLANKEEKTRNINVLGSYNDNVLKYRFRVADNVVEGQNTLRFNYTVGNYPGVSGIVNLRVDVKSTETPLSVSAVRINPEPLAPGEIGELMIAVTNPSASSNIRDLTVALQLTDLQGGNLFNLPFAPRESTNKKSINRILPGQTTEFRFSLISYPDADSKIYKIPVMFSYYDDVGNRYEDASIVSINVNSKPDLYVIIESINVNKNLRTGDVIFDVVNQGISDIKLLTVKLQDSNDFELVSASNKEYLGNIDSDDFKSARYRIKANDEADELAFNILLTYRDALNNEFSDQITISHKLRAPEGNGNGTTTLIIVIVILAVLFYFWHKRKQRRKKLLEEDD